MKTKDACKSKVTSVGNTGFAFQAVIVTKVTNWESYLLTKKEPQIIQNMRLTSSHLHKAAKQVKQEMKPPKNNFLTNNTFQSVLPGTGC